MTVNSRSKGRAAEQAAARWLTDEGWPTKRRLAGNGQAGDLLIEAAPHVVVDVKDRPTPRIVDWLEQLEVEAAGRRCQALLWKPWSQGPRPGEWLAVVANHPLDWFGQEVGTIRDPGLEDLTTPVLRSVLGWLDIEHGRFTDSELPSSLFWDSIEFGEWLLMRGETFAREVLPCWEGLS